MSVTKSYGLTIGINTDKLTVQVSSQPSYRKGEPV